MPETRSGRSSLCFSRSRLLGRFGCSDWLMVSAFRVNIPPRPAAIETCCTAKPNPILVGIPLCYVKHSCSSGRLVKRSSFSADKHCPEVAANRILSRDFTLSQKCEALPRTSSTFQHEKCRSFPSRLHFPGLCFPEELSLYSLFIFFGAQTQARQMLQP